MDARWYSYRLFLPLLAGVFIAFLVVACSGNPTLPFALTQTPTPEHPMPSSASTTPPRDSAPGTTSTSTSTSVEASVEGQVTYTPDVTFTLRTGLAEGKLAFTGVGSTIDGEVNPTLQVEEGDVVQVTLINGDGVLHDIAFPDFNAVSDRVVSTEASTTIVFRADRRGKFFYFCSVPGHRQAGMEGQLIVGEEVEAARATAQSVTRAPTDLPSAIGDRSPQSLRINLEAVELEGQLDDGITYTYWTFNGKVPGPFLRVRVGDTVELRLKNRETSQMIHSIDLHAVTGPGGGAAVTQASPGQEKAFTFKALNPGLYVYHCATPMVAHHIANGMYGLILVEPEEGLSPVDREFYVMQGEIYTQEPFRQSGHHEFSVEKLLAERPEYFLFNGAAGALTEEHPLQARVGERVRIFFGVGGPNLASSFHVIGEIFDRVYDQAFLTSPALTNVQTTLVPPGGATVVEFDLEVPGRYILVDHALSRVERGLAGFLMAEGPENPEVFREGGGTP
jgi:nitrite reductase (NO-forming)